MLNIILADDSELILERLKTCVGNIDQVKIVGVFNNGENALTALKNLKPDLAILDIQMPKYSGLDILQEIRKENKTTIFVILTLFSSEYYRRIALQLGADYFFSKIDDFEKIPLLINALNSTFKAKQDLSNSTNQI